MDPSLSHLEHMERHIFLVQIYLHNNARQYTVDSPPAVTGSFPCEDSDYFWDSVESLRITVREVDDRTDNDSNDDIGIECRM